MNKKTSLKKYIKHCRTLTIGQELSLISVKKERERERENKKDKLKTEIFLVKKGIVSVMEDLQTSQK